MVIIHAASMLFAYSQPTAFGLSAAPTPMIDELTICVPLIGNPIIEAETMTAKEDICALTE